MIFQGLFVILATYLSVQRVHIKNNIHLLQVTTYRSQYTERHITYLYSDYGNRIVRIHLYKSGKHIHSNGNPGIVRVLIDSN